MVKRMLIDASHAEEIRVVVANGTRLEEFDFETAAKKQLKGNFYLAKVMRVEPSLQAAFVEYGGNRHGFLPFGEIHPDYYQIPVADREALFAEQQDATDDNVDDNADDLTDEESGPATVDAADARDGDAASEETDLGAEELESGAEANEDSDAPSEDRVANPDESVETLGGDDIDDEAQRRLHVSRSLLSRRYKIQEVIKKRQVMLIQVVKEERGNKGAALTTYLSLAGRYCVLMPNAVRGGGISRKIVNADDRKRLKAITAELKVPSRMAVIVRTAGLARTRAEIKRDFEYLLRQWEGIRKATLESSAPVLINEEANLIRRSIRDLYSRDIDQIQVEGEEGYRIAKDFMRTLIPSHSSRVQPYRDRIPLFTRYQIESQLDAMYSPQVQLRSGGYLVINPTEALVSIDVNSGRATKMRTVEETALTTNQEAADEIARQLRLRDLAGLVVIDFIDMDENRNQRNIERRFKEAMRDDRARIQIGRISPFGLLELSRQRLRPSILETATEVCSTCAGTGVVRATASSAVHVLRAIEEEGLRERSGQILVHVPGEIALYILNHKRDTLGEIESRYAMEIAFKDDPTLVPPMYTIETLRAHEGGVPEGRADTVFVEDEAEDGEQEAVVVETADGEEQPRRRRRRRKPRTGKPLGAEAGEPAARTEEVPAARVATDASETAEPAEAVESGEAAAAEGEEDGALKKRRRRGRRGGRRRNARSHDVGEESNAETAQVSGADGTVEGSAEGANSEPEAILGESSNLPTDNLAASEEAVSEEVSEGHTTEPAESEIKPKRASRSRWKRATEKQPDNDAASSEEASGDEPLVSADVGNSNDGGDPQEKAPSPAPIAETPATPDSDSGDTASDKLVAVSLEDKAENSSSDGGPGEQAAEPSQRRAGWWQRDLS
ncbi:MAG: ribonuclease E/G [Proteobacteria bacterium]|nr:ribonuclease E/G [Pseudomonadota bacterium]